MKEWFNNESFWIDWYPYMFPQKRFDNTGEEIKKLLQLTGVKRGTVLDLCCGPGRHSVLLAKKGFKVTGVDVTPFLLKKARQWARTKKARVEWKLEDMKSFVRPNTYNLVLNMFTAFGYFDKKDDDVQVLRNVHTSLKAKGVFLIDLMGKEQVAKKFLATTSSQPDKHTTLVERHEIFDDWTRVRNEWTMIRKGKAKTYRFHHTLYSGQELKDRLYTAGFKEVKLFGDLEGREYGPNAKRLIAVARKD